MKLVIISHTAHFHKDNALTGWGATVRELDYLASLFDRVVHVAPIHNEAAPESSIAYRAPNIDVRAVEPAGGRNLKSKIKILKQYPAYVRTIWGEMRRADAVHIRCPANISLLAVVLLALTGKPRTRWIKYAGNWHPEQSEAWSYTFQRWWLKRSWHKAQVTVNGEWRNQPPHVRAFFNPCLTEDEILKGRVAAYAKRMSEPVRLIAVGRLDEQKGVGRTLEILARVRATGINATLDLVGDSPEREEFERQARKLNVSEAVTFHGWLPRPEIAPLYARSHLMVMPTRCSEGFPKVLGEAMAYGVIPISSDVSSIPQVLRRFNVGKTFNYADLDEFIEAIGRYAREPEAWRIESQRATLAAEAFGYESYLRAVCNLLNLQVDDAASHRIAEATAQS